MGVSLNGGTPKTPPKLSFLVGKPMVVGYHHSRKPPYIIWATSNHHIVGFTWSMEGKLTPNMA